MQNAITQGQIAKSNNIQPVSQPVNYATVPQYMNNVPQSQAPNPNYAGVNIQIFNPMVGTPGGYIYPQQTNSAYGPGTQGGCYPSNYYTGQYGTSPLNYGPAYLPGNNVGPNTLNPNGSVPQNPQTLDYANNGAANNTSGQGVANSDKTGTNKAENNQEKLSNASEVNSQLGNSQEVDDKSGVNSASEKADISSGTNSQDNTQGNIAGNDKNNTVNTDPAKDGKKVDQKDGQVPENKSVNEEGNTKTEKRKVVELTDDYIKTLENYLNSQDVQVRQMGAKEVVNRLTEDPSRNDDPALTALVNKMLQDPSATIRAIALSLVESRTILGDDYTVKVLKNMQNSKDGFGQDSVQATSALLKMAGNTVEKEFPVDDKKAQKQK